MDRSIWAAVIDQRYKELIAEIRRFGGTIRQNVEKQRKRDVVIVGAAATLALMAFGFFIIQTINVVAGAG